MTALPLFRHANTTQRAQRIDVTFKGTTFLIEYTLDGRYLAATASAPAEKPDAIIHSASVNGIDIWHLIAESYVGEELIQALEREVAP
jgi:hypothetical protein